MRWKALVRWLRPFFFFFFFFLVSPYQTVEISLGQPSPPPSYQLLPPPLHSTPAVSSVALSPNYLCIDIRMNVYLCFVLLCTLYDNCTMSFVRYLHECLLVWCCCMCTLYGFVENVILDRIRAKVSNRARCVEGWCV